MEPTVSLGLPVYNGADYLELALTALRGQTFADFEIIICDNCSTDATERIGRDAAAADPRVRYQRNARNLGAAGNYNLCLAMARGRYFKWCAHDDVVAPSYLEACVALLEAEPDAVLAYPRTTIIDGEGREVAPYDDGIDHHGGSAPERFASVLLRRAGECNAVFGVIRTDVLRRTGQIRNFPSSDETLLAELALWGRLRQVPEPLFFRRDHPNTSLRANRTTRDVARWFDPRRGSRFHMALWRRLAGYADALKRAPLGPAERTRVVAQLLRWTWWTRGPLAWELVGLARR